MESRKVRYSDTDLNGHLNNTKYIDYIIDTHDINFYNQYRVKSICINFEKEIQDNEVVEMYSNNSLPEVVSGKINNKVIFSSEITYERR